MAGDKTVEPLGISFKRPHDTGEFVQIEASVSVHSLPVYTRVHVLEWDGGAVGIQRKSPHAPKPYVFFTVYEREKFSPKWDDIHIPDGMAPPNALNANPSLPGDFRDGVELSSAWPDYTVSEDERVSLAVRRVGDGRSALKANLFKTERDERHYLGTIPDAKEAKFSNLRSSMLHLKPESGQRLQDMPYTAARVGVIRGETASGDICILDQAVCNEPTTPNQSEHIRVTTERNWFIFEFGDEVEKMLW